MNIIYGSSNGLSPTASLPDQIWTQDSPDVNDYPEFNDRFGNSLSSGDFNGDGRDDLAIGLPDEDVAGLQDEGAVHILYGSAIGLSATSPRSDQFWTQDSPDVEGATKEFDAFGESLSSGDFNGDGRDDLAIGIPDEDVIRAGGTEVLSAGGVNILYGSSNGLSATLPIPDQIWTQDSPDVNDFPECRCIWVSTCIDILKFPFFMKLGFAISSCEDIKSFIKINSQTQVEFNFEK